MKKSRIIGIALAIINILLVLGIAVLYLGTDRTAPKITFDINDSIYHRGDSQDIFMDGIKAYDKTDGDVTQRIVIEKTVENEEDSTIVVYYAVSDKTGNVSKVSRVFLADLVSKEQEESMAEEQLADELEVETTESEDQVDVSVEEQIEETLEEISEEEITEEEAKLTEEQQKKEEELKKLEEELEQRRKEQEEQEEQQQQEAHRKQQEIEAAAKAAEDAKKPVLSLKQDSVQVPVGSGPAWVNILNMSDDKDEFSTLFKNLKVSRYEMNKPGTYQVNVYTEDSDGNQSTTQTLTIIVK